MHFFRTEKPRYSPLVSSPLNPESCYEIPPKKTPRSPSARPSRKTSNPVSPTQRLLRQKAEAAWRSEKKHVHIVRSPPLSAPSAALRDKRASHLGDQAARGGPDVFVRIGIDSSVSVQVVCPAARIDEKTILSRDPLDDLREFQHETMRSAHGRAGLATILLILTSTTLCITGLVSLLCVEAVLQRPSIA